MKILLFTDVHWSTYSSILRKRGDKYSVRLEKLIDSMNWVENLSKQLDCDMEICLGDFFDKADCNAEELTALQEIQWNDIPKKFIVGNHEMAVQNLIISSSHTLALKDTIEIVDTCKSEMCGNTELCYLPYVLEDNRKPLVEYFSEKTTKRIIFSHNDLAGIEMGMFKSTSGFGIEEIQDNCDLFLNGHLHNGGEVTKTIINLGNLCGQNFGEDSFLYNHCAFVLDTDTLQLDSYENPEAINFYKLDWTTKFEEVKLKSNAVITAKVKQSDYEKAQKFLFNNSNVIESRLVIERDALDIEIENDFTSIDHIDKFKTFILDKLGATDVVLEELQEIIK